MRKLPIMTMTTDWGNRDPYLASMKGTLLTEHPELRIIDITHHIEHANIIHTYYILKNTFTDFPKGTLHFVGVSGGGSVTERERISNFILVESFDHFFMGIDTGIFSLLLQDAPKKIYRLPVDTTGDRMQYKNQTLQLINSFLSHPVSGKLGEPSDKLVSSFLAAPTVDNFGISGSIIYLDNFGNAVINIDKELFDSERKGRKFTIFIRRSSYKISSIGNVYEDTDTTEIIALFNSFGYLEIAVNGTSAKDYLGLKTLDSIRIEFHD